MACRRKRKHDMSVLFVRLYKIVCAYWDLSKCINTLCIHWNVGEDETEIDDCGEFASKGSRRYMCNYKCCIWNWIIYWILMFSVMCVYSLRFCVTIFLFFDCHILVFSFCDSCFHEVTYGPSNRYWQPFYLKWVMISVRQTWQPLDAFWISWATRIYTASFMVAECPSPNTLPPFPPDLPHYSMHSLLCSNIKQNYLKMFSVSTWNGFTAARNQFLATHFKL